MHTELQPQGGCGGAQFDFPAKPRAPRIVQETEPARHSWDLGAWGNAQEHGACGMACRPVLTMGRGVRA